MKDINKIINDLSHVKLEISKHIQPKSKANDLLHILDRATSLIFALNTAYESANKPKLMSVNQILKARVGFIEYKDKAWHQLKPFETIPVIVREDNKKKDDVWHMDGDSGTEVEMPCMLGYYWRMWDKRPSRKLMQETPWDPEPED